MHKKLQKAKTGAIGLIFLTVSKLQAGQLAICESIPRSGNTFFTSQEFLYWPDAVSPGLKW